MLTEKINKKYVGLRSGRLLCLEAIKSNSNKNKHIRVKCICDCGKIIITKGTEIKNHNIKSCGCLRLENSLKAHTKHGMTKSKIYRLWYGMKMRCYYCNGKDYHLYGGRGITVCNEWKNDFMAFYNWAIANGYKEGLTIDRKDVNGNYDPSNCRWITSAEQHRNTRTNKFLKYNGEVRCASEWSEKLGLNYNTLLWHLRIGWNIKDALEYNKI